MTDFDVVIVGARAAGASTALLLARAGWRVLVVDRARRGSDTLSTHALMRPAVLQLERWGLLDAVIAAGTPGQDRVVFHYGNDRVEIEVSRRLYAPRRTVLDPIIVSAAEHSGAVFRFGVDVRGVLRGRDGRVGGIRARTADGDHSEVRGRMTVGADGRRSLIAREVGAPMTRRGAHAAAAVYGYWTGIDTAGYEWCFRPGTAGGLIPTGGGRVCVYAGTPGRRFADELRHDLDGGLRRVLAETAPAVAERVAAGRRVEPIRGFPGSPGRLRRPWGPGWTLVGDAGCYTDPITAHGLTGALRDAELLARALDEVLAGDAEPADALGHYERVRDDLSIPLFDITDAVAGFGWTSHALQRLHLALSDVIQHEIDALTSLDPRAIGRVAA